MKAALALLLLAAGGHAAPRLVAKRAASLSAGERPAARDRCEQSCGGAAANSTCVSRCEQGVRECASDAACERGVLDTLTQRLADQRGVTALSAEEKRAVHEQCKGACPAGADASCITMCEVEMYQCRNSTLPNEMPERKTCKENVLKKFESFQALFAREPGSEGEREAREEIFKQCKSACPSGADSSCVTQCEVEMYQCRNSTLPSEMAERETCKAAVLRKFQSFAFVAREPSAEERKAVQAQCKAACGGGADSSCVTACQVEVYKCITENPKPAECKEEALKKFKDFKSPGQKFIARRNKLVTGQKEPSTNKHDLARSLCAKTCGSGADSSCITDCEVEVYRCLTENPKPGPCKEEALEKYKKSPNLLLAHKQKGLGVEEVRKITDRCAAACGDAPVNSKCPKQCSTEAYRCATEDAAPQECEARVLKEYRSGRK